MKIRHQVERATVIVVLLLLFTIGGKSPSSENFYGPMMLVVKVPIMLCFIWPLVKRSSILALVLGLMSAFAFFAQIAGYFTEKKEATMGPFALAVLLLCTLCFFDLAFAWKKRTARWGQSVNC